MSGSFLKRTWLVALACVVMMAPVYGADRKKQEKGAEAKGAEAKGAEKKTAKAVAGQNIDLNTASQKDLESLPGVGASTAKKIIAGRPYSSVKDLARVGVPAKTIDGITPMVTTSAVPGKAAAPKAAPVAPSAPAPTPPASANQAKTSSKAAAKPAVPPPAPGMVWVNLDTKVYHKEGTRWFGNTKNGKYMTEADAVRAGYRASKE
jgi:hypothetical protein